MKSSQYLKAADFFYLHSTLWVRTPGLKEVNWVTENHSANKCHMSKHKTATSSFHPDPLHPQYFPQSMNVWETASIRFSSSLNKLSSCISGCDIYISHWADLLWSNTPQCPVKQCTLSLCIRHTHSARGKPSCVHQYVRHLASEMKSTAVIFLYIQSKILLFLLEK